MSKAIVIGGGIIGLSSAYYLRQSGWEVTVLEKGDLSDNCSFGNAGLIVPSHFVPLAAPGALGRGLKWMLDSKSPFFVRPSLNRELLSWGIKFLKSANKRHVAQAAVPLKELSLLSKTLYRQWAGEEGLDFSLKERGVMMYFKTHQAGEEETRLAGKARELGLDAVSLSAGEAGELEPELELNILGAVHYRCDAQVVPYKLIPALLTRLEKKGVQFVRNSEVLDMDHHQGRIRKVYTQGGEWSGDAFVIAGGSWSSAIARQAGLHIPLMPGKGYSFLADEPRKRMRIPALLCEARVAVTPMDGKIRFGGTMEIGRMDARIHMNRVKGIAEAIPEYLPDFKPPLPDKRSVWYGFRPCSPDGLPYIGHARGFQNLVIATGHAMLGLSLGPATGKLVSELIAGSELSMGIGAFSPGRFF